VEAIVSVNRISSFLDSDELQTDARDIVLKENIQDGDEVLSITNGEFFWSKDGKEPILQDINLTAKKGELIAVLGQVGAGKAGVPLILPQHLKMLIKVFDLSRAACCLPLSER
jgi:ABC-type transport system involved in cytochrome bd biosynthesis fused ATPase/permease subunit